MGWGKGRGQKTKKKGFEKETGREERLHLLSKFLGNRNRGFKRSKRRKFNLTTRASHRDRSWGVLTKKTPRGRSSPTLVTFYPKGCVVVVLPYGECLVVFCTMRSGHIEGSIHKPDFRTDF